jgi:hypothetical protein
LNSGYILLHRKYSINESKQVVLLDFKSSILRVSAWPQGPKVVLFRLTTFLLEAMYIINMLVLEITFYRDRRGHDRMVVGFVTTYAISAYHN